MKATSAISTRGLNRATLARQGLLHPLRSEAADAVRRLGSLQGQHPEWPPVALAARAGGPATADLASALERRQVVRSSLMRNTIHVVNADDLWAMFTVCQPTRLNRWRLLLKADPLESPLGRRMLAAHAAAVDALRERPRSSLELDRMMAAEIGPAATAASRPDWRQPGTAVTVRAAWIHFSALVPLVHVPHDGEGYGRSLYAIASDWLAEERPQLADADARTEVARRYLAAFGPASIDDLVAYVGRGKGGMGIWRDALAAVGDELVTLRGEDGRVLFDLADAPRPDEDAPAPPRLLARWDSLLLSHAPKARERVIATEHRSSVFSRNADVRPTFLVDGFVTGTWDLARTAGEARITLHPFTRLDPERGDELVAEAERLLALIAPESAHRRARIGR
jgi:hypothetical protein